MGVNGIYGLSGSGLDIESMVKVGMMSKQNEYDKMYKKETKATWQKEAYADVYKNINDFNSSKLTDYKLQSKMNAMSASSNNDKAFTVSANGSAVPMTHRVEVKELSSNAYLMSATEISRNSSADKDSILLSDSMFNGITDNGDGTYTVKAWGNNSNTKTVKADDIALSVTLNDGQSKAKDDARTVTMTYADIAGGKTLNDLVSSINKLGLNVTAAYDSVNDSFSLYNKNGGKDNTIAIKTNNDVTARLFNNFNLGESKNGEKLEPFSATPPADITGSQTAYTGSKSIAEMLGVSVDSTREATYINDKMVDHVEDDTLDAGIERYSKVYGNTDYLVKSSTVQEQKYDITVKEKDENGDEVENTVKATLAESLNDGNLLRYARDDGKGDIIVKVTKDGDNTTYQTTQVESGAKSVSWNGVESTSKNPVEEGERVTKNVYQVAGVERGTSKVDWESIESTSTNPVAEDMGSVYIIDGKYAAKSVDDATLEAKGIKRYERTGGQGDVLVKTETYHGKDSYKVAAVESGTSNVDWDEVDKVSDNPVSTKTVADPEIKTVIGDDIVTKEGATDDGVTTYTKNSNSGGTVYVKATKESDPDDATATITKYQSVDVKNINPSVLKWGDEESTATNPVSKDGEGNLTINGEAVKKIAEDADNGIVTYEKTTGGSKIYVKTETSTDNTDPANPVTSYSYKTLSESDINASNIDWSKVEKSTTNPVSFESFMTVDGKLQKTNDAALSFKLNDGQGEKTINVSYGALANFTIDDVVNLVNAAGSSITASFEDGKFSLKNMNAGAEYKNTLSFNDANTAKFFKALGISDGTENPNQTITTGAGTGSAFNAGKETTIKGSNGEIVVDGRSYTNITDNRATIGGVTYTLLDKTETAASVTVTQDQSSIIDRVKQFVEDYNTMLQSLQDKYNETKYSDYDVLTKTQEDGMTKEQIEKWNDKAKSGLLNRDKYIGDIISKMREALSTPVEGISGQYNSAFNIGIRTVTDQGKIELDEEKLKKALTAEPNSVYEIFGKMGEYDSNTKTSDFSTSGVAQRLSDVFNNGMKSIKSHAGVSTEVDDNSELGNRIKDWQNKMSDFKTKMKAFEDMLYKKYDAMEMALQKLAMTMNYVSFNQQ